MSDDIQTTQMDYADAMEMLYRQQQTIKRLLEALKPFAEAASSYADDDDDDLTYLERFRIGQLRAARAAMGETE